MKLLKPVYFVVGMTGMFSMAIPAQLEWLAALPVLQSWALTVLLSAAFAAVLTWLTQFRRRHVGATGLLRSFATCGLLVTAILPARVFALLPAQTESTVAAVLRLALFALFCLVAVKTQPASEHAEGAP